MVVRVGKESQKKGLTYEQSQESVFSDLNFSTFRDSARLSATARARSIRLILSFPSAPDAVAIPAERSEKKRPARMPFETVRDFIFGLPSFGS